MKKNTKLEQDVFDITLKISREFPELLKYLNEVPINIPAVDTPPENEKSLKEYYDSLVEILSAYSKTHEVSMLKKAEGNINLTGYPLYPPSQDIYNQGKEEEDINPEDISKRKTPNEEEGSLNEKEFRDDMSGGDLDIPGSESDDQQENIGSEDEENNYYSLGGDNHNNLEEDNG